MSKIFEVHDIESLKYVRGFYTPVCHCGNISMPQNVRLNETIVTVIVCLTCRSNDLMCGPWPMKAVIYHRPSSYQSKGLAMRDYIKHNPVTFNNNSVFFVFALWLNDLNIPRFQYAI